MKTVAKISDQDSDICRDCHNRKIVKQNEDSWKPLRFNKDVTAFALKLVSKRTK